MTNTPVVAGHFYKQGGSSCSVNPSTRATSLAASLCMITPESLLEWKSVSDVSACICFRSAFVCVSAASTCVSMGVSSLLVFLGLNLGNKILPPSTIPLRKDIFFTNTPVVG